jgi:ketol-acid reductoisomerase
MSVEEATQKADVIIILTQDHLQADIYKNSIEPYLTKPARPWLFRMGLIFILNLLSLLRMLMSL